MQYAKLKKNPSQLLSLTGLTVAEFESLQLYFQEQWDEFNDRFTLTGKQRQRISYTRKNSLLATVADKLLFVLSYLKNNPLQDYHASMFGLTQPQCNVWIHRLSDILLRTLKSLGELPERNPLRMVHLPEKYQDVLLDGTERPIQRPCDSDRQKSCYSGKKNS
jgi:hypothetical protein